MEFLINIANILYLLSYFVKDMLSLRLFTVTAASCLTTYFYSQPEPLMVAVYWNSLFIALNIFWVVRLVKQRITQRRRTRQDAPTPPAVTIAPSQSEGRTETQPMTAEPTRRTSAMHSETGSTAKRPDSRPAGAQRLPSPSQPVPTKNSIRTDR